MIWSIIIGALIGMSAAAITNRRQKMGCIANILAGLIGSSIGQTLFGDWGPRLANMALIPSIFGAIIVIAVVSVFTERS